MDKQVLTDLKELSAKVKSDSDRIDELSNKKSFIISQIDKTQNSRNELQKKNLVTKVFSKKWSKSNDDLREAADKFDNELRTVNSDLSSAKKDFEKDLKALQSVIAKLN